MLSATGFQSIFLLFLPMPFLVRNKGPRGQAVTAPNCAAR
jgi:hypothetical protein